MPAEGTGDLQTLICVLVARPRRCLTLSNPVPWQNWMDAYLGYTLRMKTLFHGWPVMVHDTRTRRRRRLVVVEMLFMIIVEPVASRWWVICSATRPTTVCIQHVVSSSQAQVNCVVCDRKGIWHKNLGMGCWILSLLSTIALFYSRECS